MKFRIDLKILFFLVLFYLTHQLNLYIIVMIFCLIHECAHIVLSIILGFKVQEIELMPFGFFAKIKANVEDYNKKIGKSNMAEVKKIFIAIAGPLSNIFLIIILANFEIEFLEKEIGIYSNLLILIFNLTPIFPLDGGRVLKSILKILMGSQNANKIINIISNIVIIILTIVSSILILYIKNIAILFILIYLWDLVHIENKKFALQSKVYDALN